MSEGIDGYQFDHSQGAAESFTIGDVIVAEGDSGDCLYVVLSGCVEVTRNGELLAMLESGEIFGEMALLDENHRSATVTALMDVELLRIDRNGFQNLVQNDIGFANFMLRAFSRRLRHTSATASTMSKAVGLAGTLSPDAPIPGTPRAASKAKPASPQKPGSARTVAGAGPGSPAGAATGTAPSGSPPAPAGHGEDFSLTRARQQQSPGKAAAGKTPASARSKDKAAGSSKATGSSKASSLREFKWGD